MTDVIRNRLAVIAKRHRGQLRPADVVDDAKDPSSPLHSCFEWDVEKAAYQAWIDTARALIREVKYVYATETFEVASVTYVRDPAKAAGESGYRELDLVRKSETRNAKLLEAELARARGVIKRTLEIATVCGKADEVRGTLAAYLDSCVREASAVKRRRKTA